MDASEVTHPLVKRYVELLKFMADANGSTPGAFKLSCPSGVPAVDCATAIASEVINQSAAINGRKSRVYLDFLAMYSRTHLNAFDSAFQLQMGEMDELFAREESSCSATGEPEPGSESIDVPRIGQ